MNTNKLPQNIEEQIIKLSDSNEINRNWLEWVAYNHGFDFDHIRGVDDDLYAKEPKEHEETKDS